MSDFGAMVGCLFLFFMVLAVAHEAVRWFHHD